MTDGTISLSLDIEAPVLKVWGTLTHTAAWWDGATLEAKKGGTFREVWQEGGEEKVADGEVVSIDPGAKLAIRWQEPQWPKPMIFTFALTPAGQSRTKVTLTEEGWDMFAPEDREELMEAHRQGWSYHLQELKQAAERM